LELHSSISGNQPKNKGDEKMKQKQVITGLIAVAILAIIVISGCTSIALTCEDQSRQKLDRCNADCGEGILSQVCKTGCTGEHNQRLEQCAEQR
jgi:hypothetical protein